MQDTQDLLRERKIKKINRKVLTALIIAALAGVFILAGISDQIALEQGLISCHNYSPIALV